MGRQRTEEPMLDTDPRRKPGKKLLDSEGVPRQRTSRGVGRKRGEGRGASRRATLNGVARDSPGLVRQGVGALTSELAARVEPKEVNGRGKPQAAAASPFGRYSTAALLFGSCPELN